MYGIYKTKNKSAKCFFFFFTNSNVFENLHQSPWMPLGSCTSTFFQSSTTQRCLGFRCVDNTTPFCYGLGKLELMVHGELPKGLSCRQFFWTNKNVITKSSGCFMFLHISCGLGLDPPFLFVVWTGCRFGVLASGSPRRWDSSPRPKPSHLRLAAALFKMVSNQIRRSNCKDKQKMMKM